MRPIARICKTLLNLVQHCSLQAHSVPRLLCVALLVLRQGVDGQARAEAGAVGQPPVISDRTLLLQVRTVGMYFSI